MMPVPPSTAGSHGTGDSPKGVQSVPGLTDGLGERWVIFDPASAASLEVLRFKQELAEHPGFESGLRNRVEEIKHLRHPSLAIVRSVERLQGDHGLALVSKHMPGRRLADLLPQGRGPALALDLLRHLMPALAALQQAGEGVTHGALTANRILVGLDGRLIIVEPALGSAIRALNYSPTQLRYLLDLPVPDATDSAHVSRRTDVIQLAFVALSALLRRPLEPTDYPSAIPGLLDELVAAIGRTSAACGPLQAWFERSFQLVPHAFADAHEAAQSLTELPATLDARVAMSPVPAAAAAHEPAAAPERRDPGPVQAAAPVEPEPPAPSHEPEPVVVSSRPVVTPPRPAVRKSRRVGLVAGLTALVIAEAAVIAALLSLRPVQLQVAEPPRPIVSLGPGIEIRHDPAGSAALSSGPPPPPSGESVPATPAPAPPARPAGTFGGVKVTAPFDLQVVENGAPVGSSAGPIAIAEGSHVFELINTELGFRTQSTITVRAGQLTNVSVAAPNGRVSINALPWADVTIDGTPAGQTPLANLPLPIGQHEFVFKNPQHGEQRQTVLVKADGITRISAVFPK